MHHLQNVGMAEKRPLVSFIIPCYNIPVAMLRECVDSILAVKLDSGEREVLLIDDGSTTDYSSLAHSYSGKLSYIRQENGGLSAARNTGIERSHGEYIQFVDGDDRLIPHTYDACITLLKKRKPDLLLFRFTVKDEQPRLASSSSAVLHFSTDYLRHHNLCASACSYVFRRNVAFDLRFTPGLLHEDEEFTPLLFLRATTVLDSRQTAYYYRQREQSIVHTASADHLKRRLDDTCSIILRLHNVALTLASEEMKALRRRVSQLTMDYIYNMLRMSPSFSSVETRIRHLRDNGLYPLPLRGYTLKYLGFCIVANVRVGLRLLHALWSHTKR